MQIIVWKGWIKMKLKAWKGGRVVKVITWQLLNRNEIRMKKEIENESNSMTIDE